MHTALPSALRRALLDDALCSESELEQAELRAHSHGGYAEDALIELGAVDEATLLELLARLHHTYFVSSKRLLSTPVDERTFELLGAQAAQRFHAIPVRLKPDAGELVVAAARPGEPGLREALEHSAPRLHLRELVARPSAIELAIARLVRGRHSAAGRLGALRREALAELERRAPRAPKEPLRVLALEGFADWYDRLDERSAAAVAEAEGLLARLGGCLKPPLSAEASVGRDIDEVLATAGRTSAWLARTETVALFAGALGDPEETRTALRVLRVDTGERRLRIFYAIVDRERAVLLFGGDADEPGFYGRAMPEAQHLLDAYLSSP